MTTEVAETGLVDALLQGVFEVPLWSSFLHRLRETMAADEVTLIFRPPGRPLEDALHLRCSYSTPYEIEKFYRRTSAGEPAPRDPQLEGRLYTMPELFDLYEPADAVFYGKLLEDYGITALCQARVREPTGVDAWLTVARRGADFSPTEVGRAKAILPVLRRVLQIYVAMERERFAASVTAEAVRRLQFGWLTLDGLGNILDCDEQAGIVLANSGVLSRSPAGRLIARPTELEHEIFEALRQLLAAPGARPRAITLCREPWMDMLLVPARAKPISGRESPAAIAYVHGDSWTSSDRCEQLAELFALSMGEARVALALSRGMTIAEAAEEFGLTEGSARIYTKRIYAKTGARGLPDLVRIVMRSVLAIAPEA